MSTASTSRAFRVVSAVILASVAFASAARERAPEASSRTGKAPVQRTSSQATKPEAEATARRVPFCTPPEKVVCTLGPPPVCSCQ
jgi:hypothetical protein